MTKKLIVIILSVILCLAVVGGCFALYFKGATNVEISFGTDAAIVLSSSVQGGGELDFGNVALNPDQPSRQQVIVLDVGVTNKEEVKGMSGLLTISMSGPAAGFLKLSATTSANAAIPTNGDGALSTNFELNNLPEYITLKVALPEEVDDATFGKNYSNKSASIKVTWEVVDWAPVENAYYIVGSMSGWDINQNAIILNGVVPEPTDGSQKNLAQLEGVSLKAGQEFKIRQYKAGQTGNADWLSLGSNDSGLGLPTDGSMTASYAGSNIEVTKDGVYNIYVNHEGLVYIATPTTPAA